MSNYPEFMYAIIATYLEQSEGDLPRRLAGSIVIREERKGKTYKNGVLHSYNDVPAVVNGADKEWYKDGVRHRDNDKPAIETPFRKEWWVHGVLHRYRRPAIIDERLQIKEWHFRGRIHREFDLPAVIKSSLH